MIAIVDDGRLDAMPAAGAARTPGLVVGALTTDPSGAVVDHDSPINYEEISRSAMDEGLFCALVRPVERHEIGARKLATMLTKADLIVLDWRIKGSEDGQYAAWIIDELRKRNPRRKRQVICIYSNFQDPQQALRELAERLVVEVSGELVDRLEVGPLLIVWRSKSGQAPLPRTAPTDLPRKLIEEFADAHIGLVPLLALDALSSVRENTLPILERYSADSDRGFAIDALLVGGVREVASSLRDALADDLSVAIQATAQGRNILASACLKEWAAASIRNPQALPKPVKMGSAGESISRFVEGLEGTTDAGEHIVKKKKTSDLLRAFVDEGAGADAERAVLDTCVRYSSLLSTQYWPSGYSVPLSLGKVVCAPDGGYLLCIQPSCDSVRIEVPTPFPFVKLQKLPAVPKNLLALPLLDGSPLDLSVEPRMHGILPHRFSPHDCGAVIADANGHFVTCDGTHFRFVASVRSLHTHRVIQQLTDNAGRVGVTEGELSRLRAKGEA